MCQQLVAEMSHRLHTRAHNKGHREHASRDGEIDRQRCCIAILATVACSAASLLDSIRSQLARVDGLLICSTGGRCRCRCRPQPASGEEAQATATRAGRSSRGSNARKGTPHSRGREARAMCNRRRVQQRRFRQQKEAGGHSASQDTQQRSNTRVSRSAARSVDKAATSYGECRSKQQLGFLFFVLAFFFFIRLRKPTQFLHVAHSAPVMCLHCFSL